MIGVPLTEAEALRTGAEAGAISGVIVQPLGIHHCVVSHAHELLSVFAQLLFSVERLNVRVVALIPAL